MFSDTAQSNSKVKDSHEITLKDLFLKIRALRNFLLSKWRVITSVALLGGLIGFFYAYKKKPVYTAITTFVLEEADRGGGGLLGQYSGIAAMAGFDVGGGGGGIFQGDNILQLYTSRTMIEKALLSNIGNNPKGELLIDSYLRIKEIRENWSDKPNLKNIKFDSHLTSSNSRLQDSILGTVVDDINRNHLLVSKPDKKLSIIKVEVKSENEAFSKVFNDQIVKTVNDFYVQTKTKKSLQNLAILQHQTDSVKSVLNGAIYQSATVTDATPNLNPTRQILRLPIQRSQINAEANKAILSQLIQNLELAKIGLRKETPLLQTIDSPVYPLIKAKPSKAISIIVGCFVAGFITIIVLILNKMKKSVLDN